MLSTFRRILRERHDYGDLRSYLLNLYSRLLRRFQKLPLPGRFKVVRLRCANLSRPVLIRLQTSDILVAQEIFARHEYGFVARRVPSASAILDLGANIGLSLVYWRQQYPGSVIAGVEPDHHNARLCHLNDRVESGKGKTCVLRACAGGTSRRAVLDRSVDAYAFHMSPLAPKSSDAQTVPVLTIPEILRRCRMPYRIDLLKCDIEGAEQELFANCREWIDRFENLVVELHPPYTMAMLRDHLAAAGASFENVEEVDKGDGLRVVFLARSKPGAGATHLNVHREHPITAPRR